MRQPEPQRPPEYPHPVVQSNWYCLLCPQFRSTEDAIRSHVATNHLVGGCKPDIGIDYAMGSNVLLMLHRYEKWLHAELKRFEMILDSCLGADDIVLEMENDRP